MNKENDFKKFQYRARGVDELFDDYENVENQFVSSQQI